MVELWLLLSPIIILLHVSLSLLFQQLYTSSIHEVGVTSVLRAAVFITRVGMHMYIAGYSYVRSYVARHNYYMRIVEN